MKASIERRDTTEAGVRAWWRTIKWWPTLAGIAFGTFLASELFFGGDVGSDLGPIVAASGLVYLVAAAVQKPSKAWPVFFASVIIITPSKMGWVPIHATWLLLGVAAVFFIVGLARGVTRPFQSLPLQSIAMLVFGGIAAVVLYFDGVLGAYLVAAGLYAHAAWDAWHHWNDKVVSRSLAEFCFVLDALVATAIVIATLQYAQ